MADNNKERSPLREAFTQAAIWGVGMGLGDFAYTVLSGSQGDVLGTVVTAAATAGVVAYGYEKRIAAAAAAKKENSRPSEGPGW